MFDRDYFSMQTGYHGYKVFLLTHFCVNDAKNKAKKKYMATRGFHLGI